MDDLYAKIQIYLMKKDRECGQLRFLTSRTTLENSEHIQDVCNSIGAILLASKIPVKEDSAKNDERCVQVYKYLVLNTNFECQEHLAEDLANGHLVDMCPALSPYLLVEILWSLRFEETIAESILHFPLDLCVEILEISRRCLVLLDFQRALEFVAATTINCYKKIMIVGNVGTQSNKLIQSLELLTIHWQELIAFFSDSKFLRLHEVADLKKSERLGIILKTIIGLTKNCLRCSREGVDSSTELSSMYRITFGRGNIVKSNDDFVNHLRMLDQEFAHLLLKKLKEIDCNTYLDWASLESAGNRTISVQQSIGHECHSLMETIEHSEHFLQHDHLIECLRQLSSKPKMETSVSELELDELRRRAADGKKDCLKEFMNRYEDWNHECFEIVEKNKNLLDKEDFLNLLEYLTLVMTKPGQEEHKRRIYSTVTRVMMLLNIPDFYETVLQYILKHDGKNTLESSHTEISFKNFMAHNKNFKSPENLRVTLMFLMKNPKKILSIIVKIAIGHPEFANIMVLPADLTMLSPIMSIRDGPEDTLILSSLRNVCVETSEWNAKKFTHFIQVMLETRVFTADDLINNVFVPFLNLRNVGLSNLACVLNCLRKIYVDCTTKINVANLLKAIATRMSRLRNDVAVAKYTANEFLNLMSRIVQIFLVKSENLFDGEQTKLEIWDIEINVDPIDRHNFARLFSNNIFPTIDVFDVVTHYESRCFFAMNRMEDHSNVSRSENHDDDDECKMDDYFNFRNDFLRHLFVRATEKEYVKFATEAMTIDSTNFGYKDEYDGYENIVRITIEACIYCLEFSRLTSPDSFACLIKGLARFTKGITSLEELRYPNKIYESLVEHLRKLNKFLNGTIFANDYVTIVLSINNRANHEPIGESLRELARLIDNFGNKCLEIGHEDVRLDREHSNEAARYRIAYEFVNEFMTVNDDGSYEELRRIYKLLSSQVAN